MGSETDPRFVRSRATMLDAARELLLEHGPTAVTHARIAEHAGVGRATVYRHWPRTDQLLAEAMATVSMPFFEAPASPYRDWLTRGLTAIAQQLEHHDVLAVATTLMSSAVWDPAMDARRDGFARTLAERLTAGLQAAEEHGELTPHADASSIAALAIGPIHYRATVERAPADAALVERCVAAVGLWKDPAGQR
jgi:AcrR family transcriptional regulator